MDDYISRQDLIDYLQIIPIDLGLREIDDVEKYVKNMPAADVQPVRHGTWIWDDEGYHCSECFFHAYGNTLECLDGTYKYCPNCGAQMDEGSK